jgi:predicted dehydrogenase
MIVMVHNLKIGMIGGGQIAKAHVLAYHSLGLLHQITSVRPVLSSVAEANETLAISAAERLGFESWTEDWKIVTRSDKIDLVDIITPTYMHAEQAIDAAEHGKHILCEKPLATTASDAKRMHEAAKKAGVANMVGFNYRKVPAVTFAKKLAQTGSLGKLFQFRASFQEDWAANADMILTWRYAKKTAGGGALADLGSHVVDLARFLVGDIKSVCGIQNTFIKERKVSQNSVERKPVDVDDSTIALVRFQGTDALGRIETCWSAPGRKVFLEFELNGSEGSAYFNLERPNELQIYSSSDPKDKLGMRTVLIGPNQPYGEAMVFPAAGCGMGYEDSVSNEIAELVESIENGKMNAGPSFYDGWKASEILQAIQESSSKEAWVDVN